MNFSKKIDTEANNTVDFINKAWVDLLVVSEQSYNDYLAKKSIENIMMDKLPHQLYPSKLADTIDSSFFGVDAHLVNLVNSQLDEDGFIALRTLLEKVSPSKVKDAYDDGYSMGYSDGMEEASRNYQDGDE